MFKIFSLLKIIFHLKFLDKSRFNKSYFEKVIFTKDTH